MQTSITGRHIELTPALRNYVNNRLERLDRHHEPPTSAQIVLTVNKLDHKVEAKLQLAGKTVYAEAVDRDMYAAIDALADKLDRQLVRHKERRTDHQAVSTSRLRRTEGAE